MNDHTKKKDHQCTYCEKIFHGNVILNSRENSFSGEAVSMHQLWVCGHTEINSRSSQVSAFNVGSDSEFEDSRSALSYLLNIYLTQDQVLKVI